jgi:hypothetical protein
METKFIQEGGFTENLFLARHRFAKTSLGGKNRL